MECTWNMDKKKMYRNLSELSYYWECKNVTKLFEDAYMLSISSNLNDTIIWVRRTVTFIIKMITKTSPSFWIAATSVSLGLQLTAGTSGTLQKYFWRFQTFFMFFRLENFPKKDPNKKFRFKILFWISNIFWNCPLSASIVLTTFCNFFANLLPVLFKHNLSTRQL